MLQNAKLLKHRILIGLFYGCGLRCWNIARLDLIENQVVQAKAKTVTFHFEHLIGLKKYIEAENLKIIF
jgi:hypothetical protein